MTDRLRLAFVRAVHVVSAVAFAVAAYFAVAPAAHAQAKKAAAFDAAPCLACHEPIKEFHADGKHKGVGCNTCHDGLDKHLADAKARPSTKMDPAACGACHQKQYESQYTMNWNKPARSEKSQHGRPVAESGVGQADDAARVHARAQRAALARSYMVLDQFVVDRAFGGRFVPKDGWQYLTRRRQLQGLGRARRTSTRTTPTTSRSSPAPPRRPTRCA